MTFTLPQVLGMCTGSIGLSTALYRLVMGPRIALQKMQAQTRMKAEIRAEVRKEIRHEVRKAKVHLDGHLSAQDGVTHKILTAVTPADAAEPDREQ